MNRSFTVAISLSTLNFKLSLSPQLHLLFRNPFASSFQDYLIAEDTAIYVLIFAMVRIDHHEYLSEEEKRLKEDRERTKYWKKWGPYVAERQWATGITPSQTFRNQFANRQTIVREDYSPDGDAWSRE